jgi:hypothetical protein
VVANPREKCQNPAISGQKVECHAQICLDIQPEVVLTLAGLGEVPDKNMKNEKTRQTVGLSTMGRNARGSRVEILLNPDSARECISTASLIPFAHLKPRQSAPENGSSSKLTHDPNGRDDGLNLRRHGLVRASGTALNAEEGDK